MDNFSVWNIACIFVRTSIMKEITEVLYKMAEARIEQLLPLVNDDTPFDDPNSVELELMSDIVEQYEAEHYPPLCNVNDDAKDDSTPCCSLQTNFDGLKSIK